MNREEIQKLLDLVKYVPSDKRNEATNTVLLAASESMSFEKMKTLTSEIHTDSNTKQTTENESSGNSEILIFSDEEIKKMPKTFRKNSEYKVVPRTYISARAARSIGITRYATAGTDIISTCRLTTLRKQNKNS